MASEGEFPKVDGDVLYASEVNNLYSTIQEVYTGSDFDTTGNSTNSYEFGAITDIGNRGFAIIEVTCAASAGSGGPDGYASASLKIEIKEIGESYAELFNEVILQADEVGHSSHAHSTATTIKYVFTLTAGMKTNGFQIKVSSTSSTSNSASLTNIVSTEYII